MKFTVRFVDGPKRGETLTISFPELPDATPPRQRLGIEFGDGYYQADVADFETAEYEARFIPDLSNR